MITDEQRKAIVAEVGEDRMRRIEALYKGLQDEKVNPWLAASCSQAEIDSYYFIEAQRLEWEEWTEDQAILSTVEDVSRWLEE